MSLLIDGCRAKVDRANQHVDFLKDQMTFSRHHQPYLLAGQFETPTEYVVRIHIVQEPPPFLAVVAGEFAHNLRSCLDHLVWQVVLANGNIPGRRTQFPIYSDQADWLRDVAQRDSRRGPGPLDGVVKGWTEIESLQPYNASDPWKDPLAHLARLSNTDKHRLLIGGFWALPEIPLDIDTGISDLLTKPEAGVIANHEEPLKDGSDVLRLFFQNPVSGPSQMEMNFRHPVTVAFGEARPALTLERMRLISAHITKVLDLLENVFS